MSQMTITEALAETKTIAKRLTSKRAAVMRYLVRQEYQKDPLATEPGGSEGYIERERQAIADLETRLIAIRSAIQTANLKQGIEVLGTSRSITDWLTWRREVQAGQLGFVKTLMETIARARTEARSKGISVVPAGGAPNAREDLLVNVDEKKLNEDIENIEATLSALDGRLSLANATITIDV